MALLGVEMNKTGYMPQNSARQKERERDIYVGLVISILALSDY